MNNKNKYIDTNLLEKYYEYAMISYCNPDNIYNLNLGHTKTELYLKNNIIQNQIYYNNITNNLLWFFETEYSYFIIYRGTEMNSIENWQRNIKIIQEPYNTILMNCSNCYIHNGFNEMYSSVTNDFLYSFLPLKHKKPINIIGHSLGGALSTILYLELQLYQSFYSTQYDIYLYTYGSPRVGNKDFSDLLYNYKNNSYRIVNNRDPIPHLPPAMTKYHLYQHIHNEIWIVDKEFCELDEKQSDLFNCKVIPTYIFCDIENYNDNFSESYSYQSENYNDNFHFHSYQSKYNNKNQENKNCSYSLYKALNIYDHMNYFNKKKEFEYMFNVCLYS
jgi:hypothetical protein